MCGYAPATRRARLRSPIGSVKHGHELTQDFLGGPKRCLATRRARVQPAGLANAKTLAIVHRYEHLDDPPYLGQSTPETRAVGSSSRYYGTVNVLEVTCRTSADICHASEARGMHSLYLSIQLQLASRVPFAVLRVNVAGLGDVMRRRSQHSPRPAGRPGVVAHRATQLPLPLA